MSSSGVTCLGAYFINPAVRQADFCHGLLESGQGVAIQPPVTAAALPASRRLSKSRQFGRVFANPVRSTDRYFTVLARAADAPESRLGLTVSRRAAKRAVDRNKLKRLARESFRMQSNLPRWDFVVVAKHAAAGASRAALRASLDGHFERLKKRAGPQHDG